MARLADAYLSLSWILTSLGFTVGLILHKMPSSEMRGWGDQLIGYSLLMAAFLGAVQTGQLLVDAALNYSSRIQVDRVVERVEELPKFYYGVGHSAYTALISLTMVGMASALIPVVGPALANMYSVASTMPSVALTGTLIISFMLASFLVIFVTLAPIIVPVGVVLLSAPGGKLKGIGGWLIAMAVALNAVGPLIPGVGMMACRMQGAGMEVGCDISGFSSLPLSSPVDIIAWLASPEGSVIMGAWRFAIGSLAAFSIMTLVATALSKAIGGVASSLGIG